MTIRLPSLEQDITIDTADLVRATVQAKLFGESIEKALKADSAKLRAELKGVQRELAGVTNSVDRMGDKIDQGNRKLGELGSKLDRIGDQAKQSVQALQQMASKIDNVGDQAKQAVAGLQQLGSKLDNIGDQAKQSVGALQAIASEMGKLNNQATETNVRLGQLGSKLDNIGDQARQSVVGILGLTEAVNKLGEQLLEAAAEARLAGNQIDRAGDQARGATGSMLGFAAAVAAASAAMAMMNTAMGAGLLLKMGGLLTTGAAMVGMLGLMGAAAAQAGLAVIGLGAALAPIAALAMGIPAALAGIGVFGLTIAMALKDGNVELDAAKKRIGELGDSITKVVQGKASPAFARLFDTISGMRPVLEEAFGGVAESVASTVDKLNEFVSSSSFQEDFKKLMGSASVQAADWGSFAVNAIKGITDISIAGIPVAEQFSKAVAGAGEHFKNWTAQGRGDGSIEAMLQRGYDRASQLFTMVKNLSIGFFNLGKMAQTVGLSDSLMEGMLRGASAVRQFSTTYHDALIVPFQNTIALAGAVGHVVSQLGRTVLLDLGRINLAPLVESLTGVVELLGKMAVPLATGLASGITDIVYAITSQGGALKSTSVVLGTMFSGLGSDIASIIPSIGGPLEQISVAVANLVSDIGDAGVELVPALIGPFTQIVVAAQGMVSKVIAAVTPIVKMLAQPFADASVLIANTIGDTATKISGPLQSVIAAVLPALQSGMRDIIPAIGDLIVKIAEVATSFQDNLGGAITSVITIISGIVSAVGVAVTALGTMPDVIRNIVVAFGTLALLKKINFFGTGGLFNMGTRPEGQVGVIKTFTTGVTTAIRGMVTGVEGQSGRFGTAMTGLGTAAAGLVRGGLSSLVSFLGGPWGIALIAGMVALQMFSAAQQDAKQKEAEHQSQLESLKGTLNSVTGATTALTNKKIGEDLVAKGLGPMLEQFGGGVGKATDAILKGGPAFDGYKNTVVSGFLSMVNGNQGWLDEIGKTGAKSGTATTAAGMAMERYVKSGKTSLEELAQAWASGGAAYDAVVARVANSTGESVSTVKGGFEDIRSGIDSFTDGAAGKLSNFGNTVGDLVVSTEQVQTAFQNLGNSGYEAAAKIAPMKVSAEDVNAALQSAYDNGQPVIETLQGLGLSFEQASAVAAVFGDQIDQTSGKFTGMSTAEEVAEQALLRIAKAASEGIPGAQQLAAAFETMADKSATAADKAGALKSIMDALNGGTEVLTDATFNQAKAWDEGNVKLKTFIDENGNLKDELNASVGVLDANNAAHRDFRETLKGMTTGMDNVLTSQYEATKASQGQAAALEEVTTSTTTNRNAFIDLLGQYGINGDAAAALADQMGLIPEQKKLSFLMDGSNEVVRQQVANIAAMLADKKNLTGTVNLKEGEATPATLELLKQAGYFVRTGLHGEVVITKGGMTDAVAAVDALIQKVTESPIKGQVTVAADQITAETIATMQALGYTVETLPDGTVKISIPDGVTVKTTLDEIKAQVALIDATPGTVTIKKDSVTAETIGALTALHYKVTEGADGSITITAPTVPPTQAEVDRLKASTEAGASGTVIVDDQAVDEAQEAWDLLHPAVEAGATGEVTLTDNVPDVKTNIEDIPKEVTGKITYTDNAVEMIQNLGSILDSVAALQNLPITYSDNAATILGNIGVITAAILRVRDNKITYTDNSAEIIGRVSQIGAMASSLVGRLTITDNVPGEVAKVQMLAGAINSLPNKMLVITSTAPVAMSQVQMLSAAINAIPNKMFIITNNIAESLGMIAALIGWILRIPDKMFTVVANVGGALSGVASVIGAINSIPNRTVSISVEALGVSAAASAIDSAARARTATITVQTVGAAPGAVGGVFAPMARGGLARNAIPFAEGGSTSFSGMLGRARPMSNLHATIVPPNTPRLIGDNLRKRELFVPLDPTSARSIALMMAGAQEMGLELRKKKRNRVLPMAEGGLAGVMAQAMAANDEFTNTPEFRRAKSDQDRQDKMTPPLDPKKKKDEEPPVNKNVSFTFHQYNPQQVPQAEMINRGLQLVAAAGLIGA